MPSTYEHTGKGGPVRRAESAEEAANIIARREYGKRGHCRAIRLDCYTEDRRNYTYEAFIGRPVPGENATAGRNIWIYERREG